MKIDMHTTTTNLSLVWWLSFSFLTCADPSFAGYFTDIVGEYSNGEFLNATFRRQLVPPGDSDVDFTLAGCPSYHLIFASRDKKFGPHTIAGVPRGP